MSLPDVDVVLQDGGLAAATGSGTGLHIKVGVASSGPTNAIMRFSRSALDDVTAKLGDGPLVEAILDACQAGAAECLAVRAAASVAGKVGVLTQTGTGTASHQVAGQPTGDHQVVIEVVKGGALNEAQYRLSLDAGRTWGISRTVPVNGVVDLSVGVQVTFTAGAEPATSFVAGDRYEMTVSAPSMSNADVLAALEVIRESALSYEFIHIVGPSGPALWAALSVAADELEARHVPTWILCEARPADSDEDLDAWVQALVTDAGTIRHPRLAVVATGLELADLRGRQAARNGAGTYTGILARAEVQESPGKVARFRLSHALDLRPAGLRSSHITALDAAGFVTFRRYDGHPGIFVTNGRMMAPAGSDFTYVETRRVADKASRALRQAGLNWQHAQADTLAQFRAELETPLERMAQPTANPQGREIVGYQVEIPGGQNVLSTGSLIVDATIVPVPIMRRITIRQRFTNQAQG